MKLSTKRDAVLVVVAFVALCVEILVLLETMRVVSLGIPILSASGQGSQPVGEVLNKSKEFRRRHKGSLSWYPINTGEALFYQDTVLTGPDSTATINLAEQGEVEIAPNTLLRFTRPQETELSGVFQLALSRGSLKVRSKKSNVIVKTKQGRLRLAERAAVSVEVAPLSDTQELEVTQGEVVFENPKTNKTLVAGKRFQVGPERQIAAIAESFSVSLLSPMENEQYFAQEQDRVEVVFQWAGDPVEHLEIGSTQELTKVKSYEVNGDEGRFSFSPGRYFWRLRSKKQKSQIREFRIMPPVNYKLLKPSAGKLIKGEWVTLHWKAVAQAQSYTLELSAQQDFQTLSRSEKTQASSSRIKLKPGVYYWRIRATHPDLGSWQYSEPKRFEVKGKLKAPKTKGVTILPEESSIRRLPQRWLALLGLFIRSANAQEKKRQTIRLKFEWNAVSGAAVYRLEVSDSKQFLKILSTQKVSSTSSTLSLPKRDRYYWRVTAMEPDGSFGVPSRPEVIVIQKPTVKRSKKKRKIAAKKTPPPPKREIAKIVEEKETLVSQSIRYQERSYRSWEISLGTSAGYAYQNDNGTGVKIRNRGFTSRRFDGWVRIPLHKRAIDVLFAYQPLRYRSKDTNISAFQPQLRHYYYELEARAQSLVQWRQFDFNLGLRAQRDTYFVRIADESTTNRIGNVISVLMGGSYLWRVSRGYSFVFGTQVIAAPIGQLRQLALEGVAQFRIQPSWLERTSPIATLQLRVTPTYLKVDPTPSSFRLPITLSGFLGWSFST